MEGKKVGYAEDYTDLVVYQRAEELADAVFEASKHFPREEMYSLTDQVRRSSSSIGAQIAESWGKRLYVKHFVSKLTDADAERLETEHWLRTARKRGYLTDDALAHLLGTSKEVGRMLHSMKLKADRFCRESDMVRDDFEFDP